MSDYAAPLRDLRFVLYDVFDAPAQWARLPALAEQVDRDTADAILDEAARLSGSLVAPLSRAGDEQGAQFANGQVTTPDGFRAAWNTYAEGGWVGLGGAPAFGGMGMPKALGVACDEMLYAADSSFALYSALTTGACLAIEAHASETLKQRFLPPMYAGRWAGAMGLTEPHAGSDLGLIRTRAEADEDGLWRLHGTKIFITGGEQDLTENIIHLVLARLPDAPPGPRGISLFLVPKRWVDEQGAVGEANGVVCGAIEHKMGIKASATCVMHFEGARGYLVGEPHRGLAAMFTMMNYERLSIGIQGLGCAERSYQQAVAYARERRQGRAPGSAGPDPLLVHGDVRRMLLTMRAYTEGGRALACLVGQQLDLSRYSEHAEERDQAAAFVALLTPVAKAFFTDTGLESCVHGQQVLGGHGYIREAGQEQWVRDVRIAQIYEGTNGIQALDLLGRKVLADGGAVMAQWCDRMAGWIEGGGQPQQAAVREALTRLEHVTAWLLTQRDDAELINGVAVDYLHLFAHVLYGALWLRMASVAEQQPQNPFCQAKCATAAFYLARLLPRTLSLDAAIRSGRAPLYGVPPDMF
ncbi:acyl-CoA dehydrogenase [Isoalcanivorax beigongshangi]|uniref:Acyl-CoA dehydrogenase n=1 Tax=Isoalcanivorax beigongshangi TaxID=3238810 RepID=A0ABV4AIC0_9GAMM